MLLAPRQILPAAAAGLVAASRAPFAIDASIGGRPTGERLARMARSPQWAGERFRNADPSVSSTPALAADDTRGALRRFVEGRDARRPAVEVPLHDDATRMPRGASAASGVQGAWLGHASALVSIGGELVLCDPVWSERCSPSQHVGPRRLHPVPFELAALPRISAVVISHDHYDHLDMDTIRELVALQDCPFVVPLGIGAHLERWGVPEARIVELDWDEATTVGGVTLTAVASQHFSGRGFRRDGTLWASWVLSAADTRVYFSGDTGYHAGFDAIGRAFGGFDLALMAVGMYDPMWRPIHLDPEEGVQAAVDLGARLTVPIHWCTFSLAPHAWAEPVERMLVAADAASVPVVVPRIGRVLDAAAPVPPPAADPWWRPVG